jgi:ParB-like chromosome segregation protein Spo0J
MNEAVEQIPLNALRQDRTVWPRADYDADALARYRDCPEALPPIHVDRATGMLLDGFHRVRVHQEAGAETVPVVFEDCPPDRHLARALELNRHGAPISREDRDRVIVQLADQGLTQAEIATVAGLSQKRISQLVARYKRDNPDRTALAEALRLREAGATFREAEAATGIPKSTIERAQAQAAARKAAIDQHRQTRLGLTSLLRYAERGPWGKASYSGNCSGYVLLDLIDYFKATSVFDPMEGSGTSRDVCADLQVDYDGRDLKAGFDLLSSPLPDRQFDLVFWHPPYWPGFRYSHHPNDFSTAKNPAEFLRRLRTGFDRLRPLVAACGHLVIMIGDGRKNGVFYPIHSEIIGWGLMPLTAVLIKDGDHPRQANYFRYGPTKFIPTLHEYVLIFKGGVR